MKRTKRPGEKLQGGPTAPPALSGMFDGPVLKLLFRLASPIFFGMVFQLLCVYVLDFGIYGVWLGMITGNVLAAGVSGFWTARTLKLLQEGKLKAAGS